MWLGIIVAVIIIGLYTYAFGKIEERETRYDEKYLKEGDNIGGSSYKKDDTELCKNP